MPPGGKRGGVFLERGAKGTDFLSDRHVVRLRQ